VEKSLRASLPPIYEAFLSDFFDRDAIVETRATCDDCAMCNKGQHPEGVEVTYFRPDVKCCSFHPSIPNFLAGSILADERAEAAEGKKRMRALIANRIGVTPHWLSPSAKYHALYEAARRASFGRTDHLICPYFDDEGRCSVWRHRESICTTYYCKFTRGVQSGKFWNALKGYLSFMEGSLARWSSREVDKEVTEIQVNPHQLTLEELEDLPPEEEMYKRHWKTWVGREADFYMACAAKIRGMDRATFEKVVDQAPRGKDLLATLKACYANAIAPRLPEKLKLHPKLKTLPLANKSVAITTPYNPYEIFNIEERMYETLQKLTHDATLAENRTQLEKDGTPLDDSLVERLAWHEVLVAPDHPILAQQAKAAVTPTEKAGDSKGEEGA
jgi:hypothetical protein